MKPGIYHGLTRAEYVAIPAFNQSTLKRWIEFGMEKRCPARFKQWLDRKTAEESTAAQIDGQLVDCLLLEPDEFAAKFAVLPDDAPKRPTKAQLSAAKPSASSIEAMKFWAGFEAGAAGKEIVGAGTVEAARKMADALRGSTWKANKQTIVMADILTRYRKTVIVAEMHGHLCKAELDLFAEGTEWIFDIKKVRDASNTERGFGRDAITYGYNIQSPFYMDIATAAGQKRTRFAFLLVEEGSCLTNAVVAVTGDEVVEWGRKQYRAAMDGLAECMASNRWPSFPAFEPVQWPQWASMEADAALNHG